MCGAAAFLAGCRPPLENFKRAAAPGDTVYFVPNAKKMVALTFDDGPNGAATMQILDALRARGVKATFFLVGTNAQRQPEIVKRIAADGHCIGNHTLRHSRFDLVTPEERERDIAEGNRAIEAITGLRPTWFRPPYGINGPGLEEACRGQGLAIAGWSLDANDWNPHPVEELVEAIAGQAVPGEVILLHDGWETNPDADRQRTAEAVPLIVDKMRAAGFIFATLPEMQRHAGPPLAVFENGVRLLGLQYAAAAARPGTRFWARYFWEVPANIQGELPGAFVHFQKPRSSYFFRDDHALARPGDVRDLVIRRAVRVPGAAPGGEYKVKAGLFPPGKYGPKDRLKARSNHPQAQRAVFLPQSLKVVPAGEGRR